MDPSFPIVRIEQVSKYYPAHQVKALQSISLQIQVGERVALVGSSGSGKTTLLNLIGLIDTFDQGEIFFEEKPLSCLSEAERTNLRRARIGFIFQFFNLLPTLTVFENVALPLQLNGLRQKKQIQLQVNDMLAQVDLSERASFFPHQLSGGQMQRVAIARALVHRPVLVIADEPTGNLDSETGHEILGLLERSCQENGQTLVMATHSAEATRICNRQIRIHDGKQAHNL